MPWFRYCGMTAKRMQYVRTKRMGMPPVKNVMGPTCPYIPEPPFGWKYAPKKPMM